ncbi:maltase 1-like [Stegodyphus dumicola]|uniref:maltase 1-like n=1 Tax=Stegodyphus dumicola TaxID=202533 RepID=UPI0015B0AC63|nr:maltase 1-like [Stegodyphus dumicola]
MNEDILSGGIPLAVNYAIQIMSLEWWQKNVIYHIYLPSFKDSNDDGIGDIRGLLSKLNYIEYLNVKTLLLSPFYPSPMKDNGYDITSFTDVDPKYGNLSDFEDLMQEVKRRDLNIIVDFVANHTSNQHPWFTKSVAKVQPYSDFYVWSDPKPGLGKDEISPPNNWLSVFGGSAWAWNNERKQFYYHQFLPEQPDLNYRNPLVKGKMKKVLQFWLELGVDGFRVDAASHFFEDENFLDEPIAEDSTANSDEYEYLNHIYTKGQKENLQLLAEWREVLDDYERKSGKSKIMMTEAIEEIKDVMLYYGTADQRLADFTFNFQFYKMHPGSTGLDLYCVIDDWLKHMPKGKYPNWVMSSHDHSRVVSYLDKTLASSLQMVMMLLPGLPICYYGDEIGMEDNEISPEDIRDSFALRTVPSNSRDPMRTPMQWNKAKNAGFSNCEKPWLPVNGNYEMVNVEVEKEDPYSFLENFRHLVKLREQPSVLLGTLDSHLVNEQIFSFVRFLVGTKCLLLVLNMSSTPVSMNLSCSKPLPSEAFLEVTNSKFYIHESQMKTLICAKNICEEESSFSEESASNDVFHIDNTKICLRHIHLKAKEALVVSFLGREI